MDGFAETVRSTLSRSLSQSLSVRVARAPGRSPLAGWALASGALEPLAAGETCSWALGAVVSDRGAWESFVAVVAWEAAVDCSGAESSWLAAAAVSWSDEPPPMETEQAPTPVRDRVTRTTAAARRALRGRVVGDMILLRYSDVVRAVGWT